MAVNILVNISQKPKTNIEKWSGSKENLHKQHASSWHHEKNCQSLLKQLRKFCSWSILTYFARIEAKENLSSLDVVGTSFLEKRGLVLLSRKKPGDSSNF